MKIMDLSSNSSTLVDRSVGFSKHTFSRNVTFGLAEVLQGADVITSERSSAKEHGTVFETFKLTQFFLILTE